MCDDIGPAGDLQFGQLTRINTQGANVDSHIEPVKAGPLQLRDHLFMQQRCQVTQAIRFGQQVGQQRQLVGIGHQVQQSSLCFSCVVQVRSKALGQRRGPSEGAVRDPLDHRWVLTSQARIGVVVEGDRHDHIRVRSSGELLDSSENGVFGCGDASVEGSCADGQVTPAETDVHR